MDEKNEILDTIDSGWLSTGPKTFLFEEKVKEYLGDPELEVIPISSCTAGLHVQLLAAGVGHGDEVITTPLTFCATINTILYAGAKPVLVDIDPVTFSIDLNKLESVITPRTKAVVPVYYAGQAIDHDSLKAITDKYGIYILADAAHAMGAKYKEKFCGTYEDAASFSFYATKNFTTGEGGLITTKNKDWSARMRRMLSNGINKDAWMRYSENGTWYYEVSMLGYKYNFTDIQAAFGLHQLKKIDDFNRLRRELSAVYDAELQGLEYLKTPSEIKDVYHIKHLYPIVLNTDKLKISRETVISRLKERNIGCSVHYVPINFHPYYRESLGINPGDFPVSDGIYKGLISLPLYTKLDPEMLKKISANLREICETNLA
ncbi:MAG: DegT/DnrJ/EryC1/StrS family aminotransferase [Ignavibacteriaceae bacterium]|nr:DegT/DnrJ/EryC1/StrS family aminotransferase [Ignavibacteriaceae bacterium]